MQPFSFFMPTEVRHGNGIIRAEKEVFRRFGRRALLVTGARSAEASGALKDVVDSLEALGMEHAIFDKVEPNPSLANVEAGGARAREFQPDFILAIGGGSPMDAAKAIAVLAVNDMRAEQLYDGNFAVTPLPIVAIPTTAGTGSEVTPYSVLTLPDEETKKGFGQPSLFPKVAFLDPVYCQSLSRAVTIDTAVDALSHLVEGYLSRRANAASDMLAEEGMRLWGTVLASLRNATQELTLEERDVLLVASTLGGMTISHTGTAFVHSLGYPLTFYHDIPHGQANGLLLPGFLRHGQSVLPKRVETILACLQLDSIAEISEVMGELFQNQIKLTSEQIDTYTAKTLPTKNVKQTPGEVTEKVLKDTLTEFFS